MLRHNQDNQDLYKTENPTEEQYITPSLKNVEVDLSKYDTIILGTPVWWYKVAPPIRTFLKENKLDGKRVIPFATNAGWLGDTFKEIRVLCPNSNIENELSIKFSVLYTGTIMLILIIFQEMILLIQLKYYLYYSLFQMLFII